MSRESFIGRAEDFETHRSASRGRLEELIRTLVARARVVDPHLHILARDMDPHEIGKQVAALFERFPEPEARPPLFGVPVGVKDIIRVGGAPLACGSLLPPALFEGGEARCVRMLRDAGAVILAQTATTEFAYFEPAATKNPHNPRHTPGGSSSGSAAGVAAGLFPLALGTQTAGSVIRPASYCGVVGVKPSFGAIPTDGVIPFSRSVDHVGFFCRTAADIPAVMAAFDPLWADGGRAERLRAGVPAGPFLGQVPPLPMESFGRALALLEAGGIEIVRVPCLDDIEDIAERHRDLMAAEFAREQERLFADYGHLYRPGTAAVIERGLAVPPSRVDEARRSCADLCGKLTELMDVHGLDLWLCPSTLGEAPAGLRSTGSPAMNVPWTHAGLPAVSLPAGKGPAGLPLGLQCVGRHGGDSRLAAAARRLEALLRGMG